MAKTVGNDEERLRRIILVAEFVMETGLSSRKTAEYFTQNKIFSISNCTVSDYCAEYEKLFPKRSEKLKEVIDANKAKGINDEEIASRVITNANYVVNNGMNVEQIANMTNQTYWSVYYDLTKRLPLLDSELYSEVSKRFEENSTENLHHGR